MSTSNLLPTKYVLVRWSVDGWFYPGIIIEVIENATFLVEFEGGSVAIKEIEDIIPRIDSAELEEGNYCLSRAQNESCYGPAVVECSNDTVLTLRLHESDTYQIARTQAYPITRNNYMTFRQTIIDREKKLENRMILAFREKDRRYGRAIIKRKSACDARSYDLWFADGHNEVLKWEFMVSMQKDAELKQMLRTESIELKGCPTPSKSTTDANDRPMKRGDAVIGQFPGSTLFGISRVFDINKNGEVSMIFEEGAKNTVPGKQCYWLDVSQYNRVMQICSKTKVIDTLKLPDVDTSIKEKFHKK